MEEQKTDLVTEWYAHVAEIVDRIVVESLKGPALQDKANRLVGEDQESVEKVRSNLLAHAQLAADTAITQQKVLRQRLEKYPNGFAIAELIIGIINAAVNTGVVARFENLKREEQARGPGKNSTQITEWDDISRDACEARAAGKSMINRSLEKLIPGYTYPAEVRTF